MYSVTKNMFAMHPRYTLRHYSSSMRSKSGEPGLASSKVTSQFILLPKFYAKEPGAAARRPLRLFKYTSIQ